MKISVFFDHVLQAVCQTGKLLPEILQNVREAGIEAVEINLQYLLEHEEVLSQLEQAGLRISCIYDFYDMDRHDESEHATRHIETAVRVGAPCILVVPGFVSEAEAIDMQMVSEEYDTLAAFMDNNKAIQHMVRQMQYVCKLGIENNINVTIEDFDDIKSPVSCVFGIQYFLEHVPNLKYTLDMGNFAYSDEDVLYAYEVLKHKIVHVHCKDRGAVIEDDSISINKRFNKGLLTVAVGDGYIPVRELIEKIICTGYDGYFAIEHFDAPDQEGYIKRSAMFLQRMCFAHS